MLIIYQGNPTQETIIHTPLSKREHCYVSKIPPFRKSHVSTFLGLFPTCWVHAEFQFSLPLNGMQLSGKVLREFPVLQSRIHRNALLMNRSPWQHGRGSEDWLPSAAYRAPATSSSHLSHAARLPHLQTFQLHVMSFI